MFSFFLSFFPIILVFCLAVKQKKCGGSCRRECVISCGRTCSRCTDPSQDLPRGCPPEYGPESSSSRYRSGKRRTERCIRCTCWHWCSWSRPPLKLDSRLVWPVLLELCWQYMERIKIYRFYDLLIDFSFASQYNICGKSRRQKTVFEKKGKIAMIYSAEVQHMCSVA